MKTQEREGGEEREKEIGNNHLNRKTLDISVRNIFLRNFPYSTTISMLREIPVFSNDH
jgi:hypothetical protein